MPWPQEMSRSGGATCCRVSTRSTGVTTPLSPERYGLRGAVLPPGLHAVSVAVAVHEVGEGAADHRAAAARAARGAPGGPPRAGDGRIPVAVRGPGGDRGD